MERKLLIVVMVLAAFSVVKIILILLYSKLLGKQIRERHSQVKEIAEEDDV